MVENLSCWQEMFGQHCCCSMNALPGSSLNHFQSGPLSNNRSATLRQQFAYLCVPLERDYHQKLDLLQI